mgnify:CR=1 FL=1
MDLILGLASLPSDPYGWHALVRQPLPADPGVLDPGSVPPQRRLRRALAA